MELNFTKTPVSCLRPAVRGVQNSEQTQEIRLPDGMPDIGHILCAWGQPVLRGKEWRSDSISFSGGMMVWVLYAPEDGGPEQCIDAWIPFQMRWDLPENTPEGTIRIRCLPRFVDARNVSPRKIMVRTGISALAEALVPDRQEICQPAAVMDGVELLRSTYPLRLPKEAGEKSFQMEEDLVLPESAPRPEKMIYFIMTPKIADKKVLANKIVFRGSGDLHVLYRSEDGQLHNWDFEVPYSQYTDLDREHSADAQTDVALMPTNLELELDEDGRFRFKGGMTAQYLVTDKQLLEVVEDAYAPGHALETLSEELELPAILENRRENLYGEQSIPGEANIVVDASFSPEFPRQRRGENGVEMTLPGTFQVLYYGEDGILRSGTARWEGQHPMRADEESSITGIPMPVQPQTVIGNGQILAKTEIPMELTTETRQQLPVVSDIKLGEPKPLDPNRPTLILRRAGESRLWDLAKGTGSTIEAIRQANGLSGEPAPGQMLLIPVS